MPSRIYKIIKIQIGELPGEDPATGPTRNATRGRKQLMEIGRLIEHEHNGNKWLSLSLTAANLQPVLFQLVKPFMRRGSGEVEAVLYDPPMRQSLPARGGSGSNANTTSGAMPSADDPDAPDWADPDQA